MLMLPCIDFIPAGHCLDKHAIVSCCQAAIGSAQDRSCVQHKVFKLYLSRFVTAWANSLSAAAGAGVLSLTARARTTSKLVRDVRKSFTSLVASACGTAWVAYSPKALRHQQHYSACLAFLQGTDLSKRCCALQVRHKRWLVVKPDKELEIVFG